MCSMAVISPWHSFLAFNAKTKENWGTMSPMRWQMLQQENGSLRLSNFHKSCFSKYKNELGKLQAMVELKN